MKNTQVFVSPCIIHKTPILYCLHLTTNLNVDSVSCFLPLRTYQFIHRSAKGLTAKKSEKQNRVMKSGNAGGKRAAVKHNLPIKSAGCKVLKQC